VGPAGSRFRAGGIDIETPLRGRFNVEKFALNATRYNGVPVLGLVALIDETTAIAGDMELVHAAIDRRGQETNAMPRIDALREKYSIWGFGTDLPTIERFEFGAAFQHGLQLTAEIRGRSDKDSEQFTSSLRILEAMMKGKAKKPAKGSAFDLNVDNGTLKVSLAISEAELMKAIKEERGSMLTAFAAGMPLLRPSIALNASAPVAVPVPAPPAPLKPPVLNTNGDTVIVTLPGGR